MANYQAILSVGNSLVTRLRNAYPGTFNGERRDCAFRLVSSGELTGDVDFGTAVILYLYRVTVNEYLRNTRRTTDPSGSETPLSLDLHYLISVWADNAAVEHTVLAWTMRQLHRHPMLDSSSLSREAEWEPGDIIQLIPAELSTEDIMRIWDALDPPYRLSVSYIARVVRIDADADGSPLPVVATRFTATDREAEPDE